MLRSILEEEEHDNDGNYRATVCAMETDENGEDSNQGYTTTGKYRSQVLWLIRCAALSAF